jgi:hypothetical protein
MAVFFGCRKGLEPPRPVYMSFFHDEVTDNGGRLEKTDAIPPWPTEYNAAHHEIVEREDDVAAYMTRAYSLDETRLVSMDRETLLAEVCRLLERPDAHTRLIAAASWRFRKLFSQERSLWDSLADRFPHLREDQQIKKLLRDEQKREG